MKTIFFHGKPENWPSSIIIHTDGASRGNPGGASIGILVSSEEQEVIYEYGAALGEATNNYAEYMAVYKALDLALKNKVKKLVLYSDSQLVVEQMMGRYKVKSLHLRPLYEKCKNLSVQIPSILFKYIRREENKRADEIANIVLDSLLN